MCKRVAEESVSEDQSDAMWEKLKWSLMVLNMEVGHEPKNAQLRKGKKNNKNQILPSEHPERNTNLPTP